MAHPNNVKFSDASNGVEPTVNDPSRTSQRKLQVSARFVSSFCWYFHTNDYHLIYILRTVPIVIMSMPVLMNSKKLFHHIGMLVV